MTDSLADLASRAGYYDQSHMYRDFRTLSGRTPRELLDIMSRTSPRHGLGHIQPFNDFGSVTQPAPLHDRCPQTDHDQSSRWARTTR
ncbi:helix-turn-helix domain-containing protein [Streptomyces sp. NBC_00459]